MNVSEEIFKLINSGNVNLYKTCHYFYYYIEIFYKQYKVDMNRYLPDQLIYSILYIPTKSYDMNYICTHTYNVSNYIPQLCLFDKLVKVELDNNFNSPLILPITVTHFKMGRNYNHPIPDLPNLITLICGRRFNQPLINQSSCLKVLKLGMLFENDLILPDNLIELDMGSRYDFRLNLPNKLEYLKLGFRYNQPIDLPDSLKVLKIYYKFNQPLNLPTNLKKLYLGEDYSHDINFSLIDLHHLSIGKSYRHPLKIPSTLTSLHLPKQYPHVINITEMPLSLKQIRIDMEIFNLDLYR